MFIARLVVPRFCCLFIGVFSCITLMDVLSTASAQDVGVDEELAKQQKIVDRFLTVLEKNPRRGTALDRVYGFHVESGTLDILVQRFQERTVKNPQDGVAWMILGLIESQRGRDAAAVEAFSKATAASPNDPLPAYYLGQSQVLVGQPDQAVKGFELALTRKPAQADLLEIFQALGRVHQRAQRTQEALEVWARLEKLFPNDARVQEQIAAALAEENQSALALPRYEKLIQLTKDDYRKAVYRIEAAELKVKLNRSQEAIGELEKLLATLNPSSWLHREVRRKIDDVFLRTDDQDGLAKYYLASVTKNPEDVDGMARLARILARQGRVPEAQVWLNKALKLAPTRKELRQTFIEQLVEDQRYTEAIAQYELLDKAEPNNPDILRDWGKLILRETSKPKEDRLKLAETVWRRLLISKPKDPLIATQVADLFRHSEMSAAALELYQKAVSLAPNEPQYLEYLGEYFHQLKREDEALSTWKKITEGKKRTATNLARLAEVLSSFGYLKQAIPEIQAACALEPKDLALHVKAADLLTKAEQYPVALEELTKAESLAQNTEESELILSAQLKVYQLEDSLTRRAAELDKQTQSAQPTAKQLFLLARYQEALRKHPEATRAIEAALKLQPQSIPFLASAARIYEQAGELKTAVDLNQRLAVIDRRGRGDYLKYIAQLETQLGRTDEALKAGRDLIASAPANTESYDFYANLCFRLGKTDEGLQTLRRAVRLNPNDPKLALTLAESLANQYRTEEAIELYWQSFDKSTALDDKLNQIQKLTELYLQTNHFDKLLERVERIRRDAEDKREATICLSQAYSSAGDYGMARQELESLLTDNTRDTQLLMQLSKLSSTEGDLTSAIKYQQQLAKLAPGPETEYPLATLLAQNGSAKESTAITVRLASKEQDPEKILRSLDSLLNSGQFDTVLQLTEARLREEPKNWELIYREGVALAKKQPEAAARRFQSLLDLPNSDGDLGIVAKNRQSKAAKSAIGQTPASLAAQRAMVQLGHFRVLSSLSSISSIKYAVGLSSDDPYSSRQMSTVWTPTEFGQARMAAVGWLYRFARDNKKGDEYLAKYQVPAQSEKASPTALMNGLLMYALTSNESSSSYLEDEAIKPIIRRLVALGDPAGQGLFMSLLQNRMSRSSVRAGRATTPAIAPLSADDLSAMMSCYAAEEQRYKSNSALAGYAPRYLSVVMFELKLAGKVDEEQKLYQSMIEKATTPNNIVQAIALATAREDNVATVDLMKKWLLVSRQPSTNQLQTNYSPQTAIAIAQSIGINGAAKREADCLRMLDLYLDYHHAAANQARQKPAARSGGQAVRGQTYYLSVWYGKAQTNARVSFPMPGIYYDTYALSVLRTAYEVFHRNDLYSDLQKHFVKRVEQSADGNKVYDHLALAYLNWWHEDREPALKEMLAASALVGKDWRMKLEIARFQVELQNFDEALAVVDSIAPVDQDSMRERETAALDLSVRLGDHERARQASERLFGLRLDAPTQIQLADQMRRLGMNEQAEAVMSRAQRQGGNQLSSMVLLMGANQGQGRTDIATQIAYQILRRSRAGQGAQAGQVRINAAGTGNDAAARTAALQTLSATGKLKEMISATEEQLKRSPNAEQLVAILAEYYEAAGDKKKSLELEAKQVEINAADYNLRYRYARKLLTAGKASEACDHFLIVLKASPRILQNDSYEISRAFQQAEKEAALVKALDEIDIRQIGQYYYISNMISNLVENKNKEQQALAMALIKKAWDAYPDQRPEILSSSFYNKEHWKLPEIYAYGKQSLIPTAKRARSNPWTGLDRIISYSDTKADSLFSAVVDAAAEHNELQQLRDEIAKQAVSLPNWKAAPLMIAIIDLRSGKIDAARPILTQAAEVTNLADFPVDARWIVGQEILAKEELRPLAIKMYEATIDQSSDQYNGREFSYGPGAALVKLYIKMGNRAEAKKILVRAEQKKVAVEYDQGYQTYARMRNLDSIAQSFESIDAPLDAMRVYRQLITDPAFSDPAFVQNYGRSNSESRNLQNLKRVIAKAAKSTDADLFNTLLMPNSALDKPAFDLMLNDGAERESTRKLESHMADLLASQKLEPATLASMLTRLEGISKERPQDFSVRIVAALLVLSNGTPEQQSRGLSELTKFVTEFPLEEIPEGQRPNARQRESALQQVGLWPVAVECLKHEDLRSASELLMSRALAGARRQSGTNYAVAIFYHQTQAALTLNDMKTAEQKLSSILELALARPKLKRVTAPPTGTPPGNPVPRLGTSGSANSQLALVPPISFSQFRLAMLVADIATQHNMQDLAIAAIAGSLVGGLPVPDTVATLSGTSLGMSPALAPVRTVRSDSGEESEINAMVASHLPKISSMWLAKGYPPQAIYTALHDIVLPKSRSNEIVLYTKTLDDWKNPQSLGRELVHFASAMKSIDTLRKEIVAKESRPESTLNANVMLALIALETKDNATAIASLRKLGELLKSQKRPSAVLTAAHAGSLAILNPELAADAVPILEEAIKLQPDQGAINAGERLVVDYYLKNRKLAELRAVFDAKLQAIQTQYSSYEVDYALYMQRRSLGTIVGLVGPSNDLPLMLEYSGRYLDVPDSNRYGNSSGNFTSAIWSLARQVRSRPAEEQYALLRSWTLPAEKRRTVRYAVGYLPGQQVPTSFLSPAVLSLGEIPAAGLVSNFSMLVDAAGKAGKLDELQRDADAAAVDKVPLADGLSTLVAIARGDASVADKLKLLTDSCQGRVKAPPANTERGSQYSNARWIDLEILEAVLAAGSYGEAGHVLGSAVLQENRNTQQFERVPLIARIIADGELRGLSPADQAKAHLPNLKLWMPSTPPAMTPNSHPPSMWTALAGEVSHVSGPNFEHLFFKYPLTGTFEFSMEAHGYSFSEGEVGYGGLVCQPEFWTSSSVISTPFLSEQVSRTGLASFDNYWNRDSVRVSPNAIRFYSNGQLVYTETAPSPTSPWLHLTAYDHRRVVYRNLKLIGEPKIPREVALISGDRLEGWNTTQGDRLAPQLSLREPPRAVVAEEQERLAPERPLPWQAKDGILIGLAESSLTQYRQSHMYYFRPLQDGETVKYEFLYEPNQTLVHPAIGNLVLLLNPDGVRLHWLERNQPDATLLDYENVADEKQNRRGPAALPLKPAEWNAVQISLSGATLSLKLNGELIFERPLEAFNTRQFGLAYDRHLTGAKVRNVILSGNWPEKLTAEEMANVLVPENADESLELKRARHAIIREEEIADNAYHIVMTARSMAPEQRYAMLREWVLPGPSHPTFRLQADFVPTDRALLPSPDKATPLTGRLQHSGGELIAPAVELVRTAVELKKAEELGAAIVADANLAGANSRDPLALLVLLAIARGEDEEATTGMRELLGQLKAMDPSTPLLQRHAELVVADTALTRPALAPTALLLADQLIECHQKNYLSLEWEKRMLSLRSRARWLIGAETAKLPRGTIPANLTQWAPASRPSAESRSKGFSPPTWQFEKGRATFRTGNATEGLYFRSPLAGNFEVRMRRTTFGWKEIYLAYASLGIDAYHDGTQIWRTVLSRPGSLLPLPNKIENFGPVVDYRLVIQDGQYTAYFNDKQVLSEKLGAIPDPWLVIQSAHPHFEGVVENVQILGSPTVPDVLQLSAASNLYSWHADYFKESVDAAEANWKKEGDEIQGTAKEPAFVIPQESILQYHRPLLEDGEIQYDYFYEAGKTEVHPALDRATLLLSPTGVQLHVLTDGACERSDLAPDNAVPLPGGATTLALKEKDWNNVKLSLKGDVLTVALNGAKVGEYKVEPANQRIFGLFRVSNKTVRVKNVTYRGDWPKVIPAVPQQELAVPQ
jgi:tetratricopeptide (TPR) repeat protein